MTDRERLLDELRPVSFAIAYRMLGTVSEAEDIVQEGDVELIADGGGKVPALARSLRGRNRVARMLINYWVRLTAVPGVSLRLAEVNGGPGVLYLGPQERLIGVVALDIAGGQIRGIRSVVNPEKLTHLGPLGDLASLLGSSER